MNQNTRSKFILVVLGQVAVILGIVVFKLAILSGGTAVLLRIEPVDPRDPLRGDYITFRYADISSFTLYRHSVPNAFFINGETVYVPLYKSGKYWQASTLEKSRPVASDGIYLKGKVISGFGAADVPGSYQMTTKIGVSYGNLEQYFIPEGAGSNLDLWNKEAAAEVVIDDNGNAVLKRLYIEGKPWP